MKEDKQHVVITGATKGLGAALVEEFTGMGWRVNGCGSSASGEGALARVDVTDAAAVSAWAEGVGVPDLLINNAAIINGNAPLWDVSAEEFSRVMDVNLKGVHYVIRAFLPGMIARGGGVVVNLSSGWGRSTSPEVAPYCCTKWGIEGLTSALADDLQAADSKVAAVALNPGVIDTDMLRGCFGEAAEGHRTAKEWAVTAAPYLAALSERDSGAAVTAP